MTIQDLLYGLARDESRTIVSGLRAIVGSTLVLATAYLAAKWMYRSSASRRHLVLALGIAGALALPALQSSLAPRALVTIPATPKELAPPTGTAPSAPASNAGAGSAGLTVNGNRQKASVPFHVSLRNISEVFLLTWLLGAIILLTRLANAVSAARQLRRDGRPFSHVELERIMARARRGTGVTRDVSVLVSATTSVPLMWGAFHPTIILPAGAAAWPATRLQDVLAHELAHVRRHDCTTRVIARFARALYWPSPFAWLVTIELDRTAEEAADDAVLSTGSVASTYASLLIDTARAAQVGRPQASVVPSMAPPTDLGDRIRAVLDATRSRDRLSLRWIGGATAALLGLLAPLASITPVRAVQVSTLSPGIDSIVDVWVERDLRLETTLKMVRAVNTGGVPRTALDTCTRVLGVLRKIRDDDVATAYPWRDLQCVAAAHGVSSPERVRFVPTGSEIGTLVATRSLHAYKSAIGQVRQASEALRDASYDLRWLARVDIDKAVARGEFGGVFETGPDDSAAFAIARFDSVRADSSVRMDPFVPIREDSMHARAIIHLADQLRQDSITRTRHGFANGYDSVRVDSLVTGMRNVSKALLMWGKDSLSASIDMLTNQLADEETQLRRLRSSLTDAHPNVVNQQRVIGTLRRAIAQLQQRSNVSRTDRDRRRDSSLSMNALVDVAVSDSLQTSLVRKDSVMSEQSLSPILDIRVNPSGDATRSLWVSLVVRTRDLASLRALQKHEYELRDTLIQIFSAKTTPELLDSKVRSELKIAALRAAQSIAGNGVTRVMYQHYLIDGGTSGKGR